MKRYHLFTLLGARSKTSLCGRIFVKPRTVAPHRRKGQNPMSIDRIAENDRGAHTARVIGKFEQVINERDEARRLGRRSSFRVWVLAGLLVGSCLGSVKTMGEMQDENAALTARVQQLTEVAGAFSSISAEALAGWRECVTRKDGVDLEIDQLRALPFDSRDNSFPFDPPGETRMLTPAEMLLFSPLDPVDFHYGDGTP
ncbi:MAG TPA: hypothetical protein VIA18_28280 [Polyangia bacterium]|jgi:hypothetical protein|nr:hypothetical protein [Polyangia bacterium]